MNRIPISYESAVNWGFALFPAIDLAGASFDKLRDRVAGGNKCHGPQVREGHVSSLPGPELVEGQALRAPRYSVRVTSEAEFRFALFPIIDLQVHGNSSLGTKDAGSKC